MKSVTLLPMAVLASAAPSPGLPFIANVWSGPFEAATNAAFNSLLPNATTCGSRTPALDAVSIGCAVCEDEQCDGSVGFGGSPDESCETTLDAMIMDGGSFNAGAVAGLRRVKNAIGVARAVMEHTRHTLLAGDLATEFAKQMGFEEESLSTPEMEERCRAWREEDCQPNYRVDVSPDAGSSCGPYSPLKSKSRRQEAKQYGHDTLSLIAIDHKGRMAAGTTTNGATHKVSPTV